MTWTSIGDPILLSTEWQYTEPIAEGEFFRLNHQNPTYGTLFAFAQVEIDGNEFHILDNQVFQVEKGVSDIVYFPPPGCFTNRRLAIKRLPKQPTLEQEVRRLFLPGYLQSDEDEIRIINRSEWQVAIEVSDYVEPEIAAVDLTPIQTKLDQISTKIDNFDVTVDLTPIQTKLDEISTKINNIQSSGSSGSNTSPSNTDPHFNDVVLLIPMDGVNDSINFTDVKGTPIAAFGNTKISTAQSKFGGASAYFDGNGDYLSIDRSAFNLTAYSVWTFELFVYPTNLPSPASLIFTNYNFPAGGQASCFLLYSDGIDYINGHSITRISLNLNQWNHIAVTRNNTTYSTYINGQLAGTQTINAQPASSNQNFFGGSPGDNNLGNRWFQGYLDEVRFTKNVVRYTANFTPPTVPFPRS